MVQVESDGVLDKESLMHIKNRSGVMESYQEDFVDYGDLENFYDFYDFYDGHVNSYATSDPDADDDDCFRCYESQVVDESFVFYDAHCEPIDPDGLGLEKEKDINALIFVLVKGKDLIEQTSECAVNYAGTKLAEKEWAGEYCAEMNYKHDEDRLDDDLDVFEQCVDAEDRGYQKSRKWVKNADGFVIGGRWSGVLNAIHLKEEEQQEFCKGLNRDPKKVFGYADDAVIMTNELFDYLKVYVKGHPSGREVLEPECRLLWNCEPMDSEVSQEKARARFVGKYWVVVANFHARSTAPECEY
jgi:hypothetical protein